MSSYVIDKKTYIKAAGFIAGLQSIVRGHISILYWYNLKEGHLYTDDEIIKEFSRIYENNAISVQLQYHDDEPESDSNMYMDSFIEYKQRAKRIYNEGGSELQKALYRFNDFISGVSYQIEDRQLNDESMMVLNTLLHKITDICRELRGYDSCWTHFNLDELI